MKSSIPVSMEEWLGGLSEMMTAQRSLQTIINNGKRIDQFTDEERMEALRINVLALIKELGEALDETGWKPWATSNHVNADAFKGELVDVWHFLMNLMLHVGMTPRELYDGYFIKQRINVKRQREGYDGVTGKCPQCKRAYDDPAVRCTPASTAERHDLDEDLAWCEVYGVQL
jgi:dimeric dUTPase (all-alpha-NTP-PPase superfamily)